MRTALMMMVALVSLGCIQDEERPAVGRFQVVSAVVTVDRISEADEQIDMLVKVDTTTGEAWKYNTQSQFVGPGTTNGTVTLDGWTRIPADLMTEVFGVRQ